MGMPSCRCRIGTIAFRARKVVALTTALILKASHFTLREPAYFSSFPKSWAKNYKKGQIQLQTLKQKKDADSLAIA